MAWDKVIESLIGSSPLAGGLAFAAWTLWKANQAMRVELTALHKEHTDFLRTLLKRNDD